MADDQAILVDAAVSLGSTVRAAREARRFVGQFCQAAELGVADDWARA